QPRFRTETHNFLTTWTTPVDLYWGISLDGKYYNTSFTDDVPVIKPFEVIQLTPYNRMDSISLTATVFDQDVVVSDRVLTLKDVFSVNLKQPVTRTYSNDTIQDAVTFYLRMQ